MKPIRLVLGAALAALLSTTAFAQAPAPWPTKPVRWVMPFAPGGVSDVEARLMATKLGEKWGQQVIVDNKVGGFTVVAANDVARAGPDGHTLLQAVDFTWTMNQFMFSKPSYDPLKDFTHISIMARLPLVFISNDKVAAKNIAELVAAAKARPGTIAVGGSGPALQIAFEKFVREAGIKMLYVPYKGGADVFKGLMTGEIAVGIDASVAYMDMFKQGRLRALATTGGQRAAALPNVPTLPELGYKASEFYLWHSLSGPAGMSPALVRRIQNDVQAVLAVPETRERFLAMGLEPVGSSAEQILETIRRESASGGTIVKELGLKLD